VGQVIIRNLDDQVIKRHRERARARGVSMEQQLRDVLAKAAGAERDELRAEMRRIRAANRSPPKRDELAHVGGDGPRGSRQPPMLVVDASVARKWLLAAPSSAAAARYLVRAVARLGSRAGPVYGPDRR
jgi:hypothetical protein